MYVRFAVSNNRFRRRYKRAYFKRFLYCGSKKLYSRSKRVYARNYRRKKCTCHSKLRINTYCKSRRRNRYYTRRSDYYDPPSPKRRRADPRPEKPKVPGAEIDAALANLSAWADEQQLPMDLNPGVDSIAGVKRNRPPEADDYDYDLRREAEEAYLENRIGMEE